MFDFRKEPLGYVRRPENEATHCGEGEKAKLNNISTFFNSSGISNIILSITVSFNLN
jgi:hypothetical protein